MTTAENTCTPSHTSDTYVEQHASASKQFHHDAHEMAHDRKQRAFINKALSGYYVERDEFKNRYVSWQEAQQAAEIIGWLLFTKREARCACAICQLGKRLL
jgi:hypothetical protein